LTAGKEHALNKRQLALAALLVALVCAGCKDDDPAGPSDAVPAPDFALPDVNATSATYDQTVSPRDYLQKVSAWYFGHAT
jgi:hypothetical protein